MSKSCLDSRGGEYNPTKVYSLRRGEANDHHPAIVRSDACLHHLGSFQADVSAFIMGICAYFRLLVYRPRRIIAARRARIAGPLVFRHVGRAVSNLAFHGRQITALALAISLQGPDSRFP